MIIVCLFAACYSHAQSLNPTGRDIDLDVSLLFGDLIIGTVPMKLSKDDQVAVNAGQLMGLLRERLTAEALARLEALESHGMIHTDDFTDKSIQLSYDPASLSLRFTAAQQYLRRLAVSVEPSRSDNQRYLPHSRFSSFVNLNVSSVYQKTTVNDDSSHSSIARLESLSRMGRTVLRFGADWQSADGWTRRPAALIVQSRNKRRTLQVGEVRGASESFQSAIDVLGFSLSRDFSLKPFDRTGPTGRREFSLGSASTVDVFVNGDLVESIRLEAGSYDLSDIPLANGSNDIVLEVVPDIGEPLVIEFDQYFSRSLLAVGESDFAFTFGALQKDASSDISYDSDQLAASGFYRFGLSESRTASINAQFGKDYSGLGASITTATRIGTFDTSISGSYTPEASGAGLSVNYASYIDRSNHARSFTASLQLVDPEFSGLSSATTPDETAAATFPDPVDVSFGDVGNTTASEQSASEGAFERNISIGMSQQIGRIRAGLGLQWSDDGVLDSSVSASMGLSGSIDRMNRWSWSLSVDSGNLRDSDNALNGDEARVDLRLKWNPASKGRFSFGARSDNASTFLSYDVSENQGRLGGYTASATARSFDEPEFGRRHTIDFDSILYANRAIFGARHRSDIEARSGERIDLTSVQASTAIAFAGSRFALGQPVNESFAIISTHPTLDNRVLHANPSDSGDAARTGWMGSALISNLGTHSNRTIRYSVDDLPLGYDLGDGLFEIKPWYGSGYALTVGSAATATVIGSLVNEKDGSPISLLAGEAVSLDATASEPIEFFTNRTGRFALSGIAPGSYSLQFRSGRNVTIEITEDQGTLIRLGKITVP